MFIFRPQFWFRVAVFIVLLVVGVITLHPERWLAQHDHSAKGLWSQGEYLGNKGEYLACLYDMDKALAVDPKYKAAFVGRAQALNALGDYKGAIENVEKCIAIDPEYAPAYAIRGASFAYLENFDKAKEDAATYEKLSVPGKNQITIDLLNASICNGLHQPAEAIEFCDKAIALDPKTANAFGLKGRIESEQGQYDKAIEDCSTSIKLFPKYVRALRARAVAYEHLGKHDLAHADEVQAKEIDEAHNAMLYAYRNPSPVKTQ